jgi:hypothetical protein
MAIAHGAVSQQAVILASPKFEWRQALTLTSNLKEINCVLCKNQEVKGRQGEEASLYTDNGQRHATAALYTLETSLIVGMEYIFL